jgi:hypothetical protein
MKIDVYIYTLRVGSHSSHMAFMVEASKKMRTLRGIKYVRIPLLTTTITLFLKNTLLCTCICLVLKLSTVVFWIVKQCGLAGVYQRFGRGDEFLLTTYITWRLEPEDHDLRGNLRSLLKSCRAMKPHSYRSVHF